MALPKRPRDPNQLANGLSYLFNPTTGAHVPIIDLGAKEYVSHWEVASWERRLGIVIPKPTPL